MILVYDSVLSFYTYIYISVLGRSKVYLNNIKLLLKYSHMYAAKLYSSLNI